jgi:hypothetical protein
VCQAHGGETEWGEGWWRNRLPSPPFYPNLVTLAPGPIEAQVEAVRGLLEEGLPGGFGVKDSFGALDLAPLGFRVLFEADWLGRPAGLGGEDLPGTGVVRVTSEAELAAWEAGWRGEAAGPRLFLPALLDDPEIVFFGVLHEGRVVAGMAGNRSGGERRAARDGGEGLVRETKDPFGRRETDAAWQAAVAGVSNIFVPVQGGEGYRAALLAAAERVFPGLPLVGYEHGLDLAEMLLLGFEGLGGLRVWAAPEPDAG